MDDSVVEVLDDSDVVEVEVDKENANINASVAVVVPDRRKATRGGVKLDDTIELDLSDTEERTAAFTTANNTAAVAGINPATPKPGLEDEELQRAFKTLVTSTPALTSQNEAFEVTPKLLPQQGGGDNNCTSATVNPNNTTHVGNYTYENNETAVLDEIKDEMCDSYEDRDSAVVTATPDTDTTASSPLLVAPPLTDTADAPTRPTPTDTGEGGREPTESSVPASSSDDYDEEPDIVSSASQSPILGKSVEHHSFVDEGGNTSAVEQDIEALSDEGVEEEEPQSEESAATKQAEIEAEATQSDMCMGMPSKKSRVLDPASLPDTCTLLSGPNGRGRVYLVGTAHFSQESNEDVAAVIQAVKPDIVVLELCKARTTVLHLDEEKSLELAKDLTLEKVAEMVRSQGALQGVMTCTMLSMSAHLTKELGMAPGGEFRRAYREAKEVPGCLVHLGDRPIQITLKRAFGSLSYWQMLKLAVTMLTSNVKVTKDDVEKYKQKDILEAMLEEMAGEYPNFTRVLVEERDTFLAHSLRLAVDGPWRTAPQNDDGGSAEEPVVVGVVGIGHVNGIVRNWETVTEDDVAQVVKIPEPTRGQRFFKFAVKSSFALLTIYGGYRILRNPMQRLSKIIVR